MNEPDRQAYLDSMGIQSYFPRFSLPAAKPSLRCDWAQETETAAIPSINAEIKSDLKPVTPAVATQPSQQHLVQGSDEPKTEKEEVRFQLAIVHVENLMVLISLPYIQAGSSLSAIQKQLCINIFTALYQIPVTADLSIKPFRWPLSEASHIDKDKDAAIASLGAYFGHLKQQYNFSHIVVLGEKLEPIMTPVVEVAFKAGEEYKLLVSRSLDEMLKMPKLKKEVWQHLKKIP